MKKFLTFSILTLGLIWGCEDNSTNPTTPTDKPVVEIISPQNNSAFSDSLLIKVNAEDDKGVVQVEIYIDNRTDYSRIFFIEPYEYLWIPPAEPDSSKHKIYAKAYDGDENMTSSKVISVYHTNLSPPSNLSVVSISEISFQINWENHLKDVKGFIIERKQTDSETHFRKIATINQPQTHYIDSEVQKDKKYSYRIKAFRTTDTTGYSKEITVQYKVWYMPSKIFNGGGGYIDKKTPLTMHANNYWLLYSFQNSNYFNYFNIITTSEGNYSLSSVENKINNITIHPEGRILFSSSTGKVFGRKYPGFAYYKEFLLSAQPITDAIFLESYSKFASAAQDGEIKIVNYDQSQLIDSYFNVVSEGNVLLAYDSNNNFLISASEAGYITQYKIAEQEIRLTQYMENPITALCFDANKNRLYFGQKNGVIKIWDVSANTLIDSFRAHTGTVTEIKTAKNGDILLSGGEDHTLKLWEFSTLRNYMSILDLTNLPGYIAIAASNNLHYIVTSSKNIVVVWKLHNDWIQS